MGSWMNPEKGQKETEGVPSYYGTFQGQPSYPKSFQGQPSYPKSFQGQPSYPPSAPPSYAPTDPYQSPNYPQPLPPSYAPTDRIPQSVRRAHGRFTEGRPLLGGELYEGSDDLPFCNLGFGWFLFIIGFFTLLPWYIGVVFLFCLAHDYRERAGLIACTIAASLFLFAGGWTRASYG